MKNRINSLKVAVNELEKAADSSNGNAFNVQLQNIKEICNQLKISVSTPERKHQLDDIPYRLINSISFIMKPMMRQDLFEGNYLEQFAEERTEQLMQSRAINQHNEFWKQHDTLSGNVYGSVPIELLSDDSVNILKNFGWDEVEVEIFDFGGFRPDYRNVTLYCNKIFDNFILVKEVTTETVLALVFNI